MPLMNSLCAALNHGVRRWPDQIQTRRFMSGAGFRGPNKYRPSVARRRRPPPSSPTAAAAAKSPRRLPRTMSPRPPYKRRCLANPHRHRRTMAAAAAMHVSAAPAGDVSRAGFTADTRPPPRCRPRHPPPPPGRVIALTARHDGPGGRTDGGLVCRRAVRPDTDRTRTGGHLAPPAAVSGRLGGGHNGR